MNSVDRAVPVDRRRFPIENGIYRISITFTGIFQLYYDVSRKPFAGNFIDVVILTYMYYFDVTLFQT